MTIALEALKNSNNEELNYSDDFSDVSDLPY